MKDQELQAFTAFFNHKYDELVSLWLKKMERTEGDPYHDEVTENVRTSVRLIIAFARHPNHQLIEHFTQKIARERIAANADLGQLVKNINAGRTIVFDEIAQGDLPEPLKTTFILETARFFDVFVLGATKAYTELKETIIEDKNRFIEKMHNDRLTILGQTAASFAHEFRNPLTSIKGFMNLLEKRVDGDKITDHYFSIIQREMQSLEEKVTAFLYLSKREGLEDRKTDIDLSVLLSETVEFLYPRFSSEGIEVTTQIEPAEMTVSGVREQLKQVFLNIINNAVEALSCCSGRKHVLLCTKTVGNRIRVSIANNGDPIDPIMLENIFEPFVTTKEVGTGLGLSVCKQIIEKHGGTIEVTSGHRRTAFHIELERERCAAGTL
ncbi:MAG TPA: ATP-binding protein [Bacillales bacterium]|nr:ATP-binding protein [Bacillales bacterium]